VVASLGGVVVSLGGMVVSLGVLPGDDAAGSVAPPVAELPASRLPESTLFSRRSHAVNSVAAAHRGIRIFVFIGCSSGRVGFAHGTHPAGSGK
jgi:hypothetical protein